MPSKSTVALGTYSVATTFILCVLVVFLMVCKKADTGVRSGALRIMTHGANEKTKGVIPWASPLLTPFKPETTVVAPFTAGETWEVRRASFGGRRVTTEEDDPLATSQFVFQKTGEEGSGSTTFITELFRSTWTDVEGGNGYWTKGTNPYLKIVLTPPISSTPPDYINVKVTAMLGDGKSHYSPREGQTMVPSVRGTYNVPDTFFVPMYNGVNPDFAFALYFARVKV